MQIMTLAVVMALGFALADQGHVTAAVQGTSSVVGTWVGGIESGGEFGFYSATIVGAEPLSGVASLPMRDLSGALRAITVAGNRVRLEGPGSLVLSGTIDGNTIAGAFEAQAGSQKGTFRLIRVATLGAEELARYQGAYRFAGGDMLLVERAPFTSALMVTDPLSGVARVAFARAPDEFITGPSVLVPFPTQQTLSFRREAGRVVGLDRTSQFGVSAAARAQVVEEEVEFRNGSVNLSGTLIGPSDRGRHPALVFSHGGGAAGREWFWGIWLLDGRAGIRGALLRQARRRALVWRLARGQL